MSSLFRLLAPGAALFVLLHPLGPSQAQQAGAPPPPAVTVSAPQKKTVTEWLEFTGQFAPVEYVEIRARVSGYLTEIHFTDGQMVRAGEPLFTIDPRPFEIALASAQAKLDQATSTKEYASRQLGRADALIRQDFVAQSQRDLRQSESRSALAAADVARAAVREAQLNLDFTRVTAPVSGRVGARQLSIGNLVSAGGGNSSGTLLTTIVSLDPLYFVFDLSEADYLAFHRAQAGKPLDVPVGLRLMDEADWSRDGRLTFIDTQLDKGSGTIRARVTLANPDGFIAPGSFGRVRMPGETYDAMLLPESAVMTDQNRKIVMTVTPDGTVAPRPVTAGPLIDGMRVIRGGLTEQDQVIVNGLMRARPGAKVTPQPAAAAAAAPPGAKAEK